jgi:parallel beta-helix repeat protein
LRPNRAVRALLFSVMILTALYSLPGVAFAVSTYYVSPNGSDLNSCSQSQPCREIRKALALVRAGDTILVADGTYKGFDVANMNGASGAPITIKATGSRAVIVPTTDRHDNRDTIFITYSSYIIVNGLRSFNANRAAVRIDHSLRVTIENGVFGNNYEWGIFTDFSDYLVIQGNECYGSKTQHGIYVSNSGDYPTLVGNRVHDNAGSGIQLNADKSQGGDGLITYAAIEGNIIYNNGALGGAAINLDGVQYSKVVNNLLYNNHATGIALYKIDGAAGPIGMAVYHNTIYMASNARYALEITNSVGKNKVRDNILYNRNTNRGGLEYGGSKDITNTDSDYNIMDRMSPNGGGNLLTLKQWQAKGHEPHSFSALPSSLFVNAALNDYHLAQTSPAIDKGQTLSDVTTDLEGNKRPYGTASDIGCYEYVDVIE